MNTNKQRIAIAEACGWTNIYTIEGAGSQFDEPGCTWPRHIAAKAKAHHEQRNGMRGIHPAKRERYDAQWKSIHATAQVVPNCAVFISDFVEDEPIPNYPSDLNAMHEAVTSLTAEQKQLFAWNLVQILDGWSVWEPGDYETLQIWEMSLTNIANCLSATAEQWAEAFLRTIGKWEDAPPTESTPRLVCPTCRSAQWAEIHPSNADPTGYTLYCRRCEEGCVSPLKL